MLGYLKFDDDGAMWFADFDGAWKYFYHDCDEETARWAFDRLGPAASSAAFRTSRCRSGSRTPSRAGSEWSS